MAVARKLKFAALALVIGLGIASAWVCFGGGDNPYDGAAMTPSNVLPQYVGKLRFLSLGDSYTIGESVAPAERWPMQLAASLRGAGIDISDPHIIARTGWTTSELSQAITEANLQGPFDLVTLLIGVNNQYRGLPLAEEQAEFGALLDRAVAFAGGDASRVVVLSIPDWGVMPFAEGRDRAEIATKIDAFNAANAAEAARRGISVVDITPTSRSMIADPTAAAGDGLHPSGKQYAAWASLALPSARAALKGATTSPAK